MVGSPGAGKSTFFKRYLAPLGYKRVNQDTLKTREKCLKAAAEYLGANKSVVVGTLSVMIFHSSEILTIFIDATNPGIDTRKHWIELAKKSAIPIRCVYLTAPLHICQHNDAVRAFGGDIVCIGPSLFFFLPTSFSLCFWIEIFTLDPCHRAKQRRSNWGNHSPLLLKA